MKLGSKLFLFSFLGLFSIEADAQNYTLEKQRYKPSLRFEYNLYSSSTNVSSKMAYKLFWGGFINRNTINKNIGSTNSTQRSGFIQESTIEYSLKANKIFKKADPNLLVAFNFEQNSLLGTTYSNDAFTLVFTGNSPFSGKWADANGFQWQQVSWRSIGINFLNSPKRKYKQSDKLNTLDSVAKKWNLPNNLFRFGISIVEGLNYRNIKAPVAGLYTSTDGLQLNVDADISMQNTPSNYSNSLKGNGIGLAINSGYRARIFNKNLDLFVKDLGFILFSQVNDLQKDTAFSYTGYFIPQQSFSEKGYFGKLSDSFFNIFKARKTTSNQTIFIPFAIGAVYKTGKYSKLELNYRYLRGYLPKLTYKKEFFLNENASLYGSLSAGGFDFYDVNVAYDRNFKNCALILGINSLEALVFPGSQQGFGGFFKFIVNTAFVSE